MRGPVVLQLHVQYAGNAAGVELEQAEHFPAVVRGILQHQTAADQGLRRVLQGNPPHARHLHAHGPDPVVRRFMAPEDNPRHGQRLVKGGPQKAQGLPLGMQGGQEFLLGAVGFPDVPQNGVHLGLAAGTGRHTAHHQKGHQAAIPPPQLHIQADFPARRLPLQHILQAGKAVRGQQLHARGRYRAGGPAIGIVAQYAPQLHAAVQGGQLRVPAENNHRARQPLCQPQQQLLLLHQHGAVRLGKGEAQALPGGRPGNGAHHGSPLASGLLQAVPAAAPGPVAADRLPQLPANPGRILGMQGSVHHPVHHRRGQVHLRPAQGKKSGICPQQALLLLPLEIRHGNGHFPQAVPQGAQLRVPRGGGAALEHPPQAALHLHRRGRIFQGILRPQRQRLFPAAGAAGLHQRQGTHLRAPAANLPQHTVPFHVRQGHIDQRQGYVRFLLQVCHGILTMIRCDQFISIPKQSAQPFTVFALPVHNQQFSWFLQEIASLADLPCRVALCPKCNIFFPYTQGLGQKKYKIHFFWQDCPLGIAKFMLTYHAV